MNELARLTPDERYLRDAAFRMLVDVLESQIETCQYTPTELREAALLAAVHYEMRKPRDTFYLGEFYPPGYGHGV